MNPHQAPARAFVGAGAFPLQVLNGRPSYINILDALNGWQLVRELRTVFDLPAAASIKHTAPVGAALGGEMPAMLADACRVADLPLSPLAAAYARARGADRVAAYGDMAVLSDPVDAATARVLAREVSDGVIAPSYTPEALAVLQRKRRGNYLILSMDPAWDPPLIERRQVFGITLEQPRNVAPIGLGQIVTQKKELSAEAQRDLLVAAITLRYTPSNSICLALDGAAIGVGAGQQSRILCTRLACMKAEFWWLRQHPQTLALAYQPGTPRPDRDNAVEAWLRGEETPNLAGAQPSFSTEERQRWVHTLRGVALASDGLIPFRDNVDRAAATGVSFIWQPGGSVRDEQVAAAADEHGMVMCSADTRLFHH
jgi:phosphoribosylaminoimidazolecarboxamide formyltransferase/IMP cyclohydrolase